MKKRHILLLFILLIIPINILAKTNCQILINNKNYPNLSDEDYKTYNDFNKESEIKINCDEKIKYIYIMYNINSTKGSYIYNGNEGIIGNNNYLHELIKLNDSDNNITIHYEENFSLSEIYIFDKELPSWVEDWQELDKADLMLFTTHADDEQLFFLGLMPTYIDKGKKIQVVYFTNHYNNTNRYHELLEGLWTIGIKYYPVISTFPDAYSENLEDAIKNLNKAGYTKDDALLYEVTQIRKYKPKVVVGHDENGEYSHGQHILNTYILKEAIKKANDKTYDIDSINKYGIHNISKLYLHLYNQNQIELDYNVPLNNFDNKTAYEISKEGYKKHYSQSYTWFTDWIEGVYDKNNKYYDLYAPYKFGLYYSSVGEDKIKSDMFENINDNFTDKIKDITENKIQFLKSETQTKNKDYYILGLIILPIILVFILLKKRH